MLWNSTLIFLCRCKIRRRRALEIAQEILENDGMPSDAKIFDRDFEACTAEISD